MDTVLRVRDAAKIMGVCTLTVRRLIEQNSKFWYKLGTKKNCHWLIEKSNFDIWQKEIKVQK